MKGEFDPNLSGLRFPYCSLISFAVPVGYLLITAVGWFFFPSGAGGLEMFDRPYAYQKMVIGFYAIALWMIVGLILNIVSLFRGERYKGLAILGACVYAIPAFMSLAFLFHL